MVKATVAPRAIRCFDGDQLNITAAASEGYRFDGWEGKLSGLSATATLILTNDLTIQARFKKLQRLVLSQVGEGKVTVSDEMYHDVGETVTLQAEAAKGWVFSGWEGSVSGSENPVKLVMGTTTGVKAIFKQLFTLTVSASVGGVVEVTPMQSEYADGTAVTLRAKADQNKRFDHWEGSLKGTNSPVKALDWILLSDGLMKGLAGLKFDSVTIHRHSQGRGDERRLYTDHFPVSVRLVAVPL